MRSVVDASSVVAYLLGDAERLEATLVTRDGRLARGIAGLVTT